jgi:ribosomal-protein-serine acetyltransferase
MTRSAAFLTQYAFDKLNMHRVEIHAAVDNKSSRAIPEKLGFKEEGIARDGEFLYDHYVDTVTYAKLSTD